MTIFRGTFLDTPEDPFTGGALRVEDGALLVRDGVIAARGSAGELRSAYGDDVVDLTGGLVLPGFVDTHVHFPQVRMVGALGMPLLDWLEHSALPEEARLADTGYASGCCGPISSARRSRRTTRGWSWPGDGTVSGAAATPSPPGSRCPAPTRCSTPARP